ncbi:hypothetical protein [Agromyces aerolatus]|uniref:hypothetical protein n=1 Tax=Agromyces sp. LY-1074 TaxID=3074080 RepID=UPI00285F3354|nr:MULTISPECIES: hypothetical protein [unclassified Agromyces]MDR5699022.1 hypothetical protein [Agromyces sp. LY-1074]MDR5705200.1 hypothetical protein [Agromyces sp. LY-1358]
MDDKHTRDDDRGWESARHEHWHGADPTAETSSRAEEAGNRAEEAGNRAEADQADREHEGRIGRWQQATGRIWNRQHGSGEE